MIKGTLSADAGGPLRGRVGYLISMPNQIITYIIMSNNVIQESISKNITRTQDAILQRIKKLEEKNRNILSHLEAFVKYHDNILNKMTLVTLRDILGQR
jgi:hypothetical protein